MVAKDLSKYFQIKLDKNNLNYKKYFNVGSDNVIDLIVQITLKF